MEVASQDGNPRREVVMEKCIVILTAAIVSTSDSLAPLSKQVGGSCMFEDATTFSYPMTAVLAYHVMWTFHLTSFLPFASDDK